MENICLIFILFATASWDITSSADTQNQSQIFLPYINRSNRITLTLMRTGPVTSVGAFPDSPGKQTPGMNSFKKK
ncbi:hypothetical protein Y1Q_0020011 [Alligator mississippiensis]|uniref:Uncharacterized protein n=1 Tax=Alligator mississippiensis TaxID=8496 RepID=A0A151LYR1_ALLMI|nr:hypothetical protein Y1Q_0020011 [Alligator mississippiensis]